MPHVDKPAFVDVKDVKEALDHVCIVPQHDPMPAVGLLAKLGEERSEGADVGALGNVTKDVVFGPLPFQRGNPQLPRDLVNSRRRRHRELHVVELFQLSVYLSPTAHVPPASHAPVPRLSLRHRGAACVLPRLHVLRAGLGTLAPLAPCRPSTLGRRPIDRRRL